MSPFDRQRLLRIIELENALAQMRNVKESNKVLIRWLAIVALAGWMLAITLASLHS